MNNNIISRQIGSFIIQQRVSDGYIDGKSLSKLKDKDLSEFLNLSNTKDFVFELSDFLSTPKNGLIQTNWVHPQIALHLAYWLAPKFAIIVFEWVKEWLRNDFDESDELSSFNKSLKKALGFDK